MIWCSNPTTTYVSSAPSRTASAPVPMAVARFPRESTGAVVSGASRMSGGRVDGDRFVHLGQCDGHPAGFVLAVRFGKLDGGLHRPVVIVLGQPERGLGLVRDPGNELADHIARHGSGDLERRGVLHLLAALGRRVLHVLQYLGDAGVRVE